MNRPTLQTPALARLLAAGLALGTLGGCSSYYKITDPASGKTFYSSDVDHDRREGFVTFKDATSKSKVTLQSSEVQKISHKEFEAATKK